MDRGEVVRRSIYELEINVARQWCYTHTGSHTRCVERTVCYRYSRLLTVSIGARSLLNHLLTYAFHHYCILPSHPILCYHHPSHIVFVVDPHLCLASPRVC